MAHRDPDQPDWLASMTVNGVLVQPYPTKVVSFSVLRRVVNRARAFLVRLWPSSGLGFGKLLGFSQAGRRSKIEIFSE